MLNESIFLSIALLDILLVFLAARHKSWLYGTIMLNILLISTFGLKLVPIAGFPTNAGNVFYAAVFFATQLLVAKFGKKEGYKSIAFGASAITLFIIMAQLIISAHGLDPNQDVNRAIETLFLAIPKIALASLSGMVVSQLINVWLFSFITRKTAGNAVYLAVTACNLFGQLVDSILFFTIAFYPALPQASIIQMLATGYGIKIFVGALSTPFFYFFPAPILEAKTSRAETAAFSSKDRFVHLITFSVASIPFFIMATISFTNAKRSLTELTLARRDGLAHLSSAFLEEKFTHYIAMGASMAKQPQLVALVEQGKWREAITTLDHIPHDFDDVDRVFLSDMAGTLMADTPMVPEVQGVNFSFRDWYKGVIKTWHPYISSAYKRTARPQVNVIAIAIPINSERQEKLGILALQINLDTLRKWNTVIDPGDGGTVFFVDRDGQIAAHSALDPQAPIVRASNIAGVQNALYGQTGTSVIDDSRIASEAILAAYRPIQGYGWAAVVGQPTRLTFLYRDTVLTAMLIGYAFLFLLNVALAFIVARTIQKLRDSRGQLEVQNRELDREHASLSHDKAKDEAILQSIAEGVIGVDTKMKVFLINTTAQQLLRVSEKYAVGKPLGILRQVIDGSGAVVLPKNCPMSHALSEKRIINTSDYSFRINSSHQFPVNLTVGPILLDTRLIGAIMVFRDISKEKALEKSKDEFLAITSHELRTPLAVIRGNMETLYSGIAGPVSGSTSRLAHKTYSVTQNLIRLVNTFLDVSRLSLDKIPVHPTSVDIVATSREIVRQLQPAAKEKHLTMRLTTPAKPLQAIRGDTLLVQRILVNLVENALKYTKKGGITISFVQMSGFVEVRVTDTGIGIPQEKQHILFGKFQTAHDDPLTRPEGSIGLGLFISKSLVEKMNGSLYLIASNVGKGSTFGVAFPIWQKS